MISLRTLGDTGLEVSRLCYGTLSLSATQSCRTPADGGALLAYAYSKGISFWDTAEIYGTYAHIREALRSISGLPVVSTKSYAYDRRSASDSFDMARRETGLDVIDVFMLHEQMNVLTLLGHREALEFYIEQRDKGLIRAVGISTHAVEPVQAVAFSRGGIDPGSVLPRVLEFDIGLLKEIGVVHPIINMSGLGLIDGNAADMAEAAGAAHAAGVGVLGMKIFGGGNLLNDFDSALAYALSLGCVDSYAVGMQSQEEIDANLQLFSGMPVTAEMLDKVRSKKRRLIVEEWCTGCGACVARCRGGAMELRDGKAHVRSGRCVLCSYCAAVCPEFAIKVV
ncbi:MAG: aldo/keto reductase [Saccharofermentanales bacterium]